MMAAQAKIDDNRNFFEKTSIHGLRFIAGLQRKYWTSWISLFVSSLIPVLWLVRNNILLYQQHNVATNWVYQNSTEINFPAISICNENVIKRSLFGPVPDVMEALGNIFMEGPVDNRMKYENNKSCYLSPNDELFQPGLFQKIVTNLSLLLKYSSHTSDSAVKRCWWNRQEISCDGIFYNHYDISGSCFVFNLDKNNFASTAQENDYGYGSNETSNNYRTVAQSGPLTGLKLLLNVEQMEYCSIYKKWHGAGFRVHIHHPSLIPTDYFSGYLKLSPGFSTRIVIKPTSYARKTEKLSRCVNHVSSKISELKPKKYVQLACIYECLEMTIYKGCNCTHGFIKGLEAVKEVLPNTCSTLTDLLCLKRVFLDTLYNNLFKKCDQCKLPCFDTQYEYQLTSSRLQPKLIKESFKVDDSFVLKNFLFVSFSFESMTTLFSTETEAYTITELFIYLGGVSGLFLGMSFASYYEIFHQILFNFVDRIWKRFKSKKLKILKKSKMLKRREAIRKLRRRSTIKQNDLVSTNKRFSTVKNLLFNFRSTPKLPTVSRAKKELYRDSLTSMTWLGSLKHRISVVSLSLIRTTDMEVSRNWINCFPPSKSKRWALSKREGHTQRKTENNMKIEELC